jgi:transcriptional regulator with XRE-family HTH domain
MLITLVCVDNRDEVREFLTSRRARITPAQAGLRSHGGKRRVPGLRRDEVARLVGVSVGYYARLERGDIGGASDHVLGAIARALRLDEDDRTHLFALAGAAGPRRARPRRTPDGGGLRASLRTLLDGMVELPACVTNARLDVVAANRLGRSLYAPLFDRSDRPANHARFTFLDPRAAGFWVDWKTIASEIVDELRVAADQDPHDKDLTGLIGELVIRSDPFRSWWASRDVFVYRGGVKRINHPAVGRLDLTHELLRSPTDPDLTITVHTAEPGTPSHDGLKLLAVWSATMDQPVDDNVQRKL